MTAITTMLLAACVAPILYESASPLLNPGESEPALYYEGPGVLVSGDCDADGLSLTVEPGGLWPYLVEDRELVEVWVEASEEAQGGESWCTVRAGDVLHEVSIMVVELRTPFAKASTTTTRTRRATP